MASMTLTLPRTADNILMIDNAEPLYSIDANQRSGQRRKRLTSTHRIHVMYSLV
jgi:hypothetical protein